MAKEDFDLDKLIGEMELTDDTEKETARKILSREKNQGFVLRQSDYDKKMNAAKAEATTAAQALAEKQEVYDRLVNENLGYKGKTDEVVQAYKDKMEKELTALRGKAVKAAELAGMSLDDIEDDTPAPRAKATPELDLSELDKKFVSLDAINRLATGQVNLILDLEEIRDVHEELIGKKLTRKDREMLLAEYNKDIATAQRNKTQIPVLMETANRLYEYSDKRSELEKGKLEKIVADAEAKGREKAIAEMSERGLPAPRRAGTGSPLFNKTRKVGEKVESGRGIALAMKALNEQAA